MNRLTIMAVLATLMLLGGCVAAGLAGGRPGTDLTPVKHGASRQNIEEITGEPQRSWETESGVIYCLYEVDAGRGSQPLMALGWLAADIATVGILEFAGQGLETQDEEDAFYGGAETTRVIVAYDESGQALGVFGEFDELPADGVRSQE
jgi:hypothetical protein